MAQCLIKLKNPKRSFDLVMDHFFEVNDQEKELFDRILGPYFLIKSVYLAEEKRFLAALVVYEILRKDRYCQYYEKQFALYILAKLLEKGHFFQQDYIAALSVLKLAKKYQQPESLFDFINKLFISRKITLYKKYLQKNNP